VVRARLEEAAFGANIAEGFLEDSLMFFGLFGRVGALQPRKVSRPRTVYSTRLSVERLEEREVMSSPASMVAPVLGAALVSTAGPHQFSTVLPISISSITSSVVNGATQLTAQGLIGNQAFTAPVTLSAIPSTTLGGTPILDLDLGAIDLNLLGLEVKTSPICLDITAVSGAGPLGTLLSDVANLLNGGTSLTNVLAQEPQLTSGLTNLLNQALPSVTSPTAVSGASTNVLNLSVAPIDLTLLGLNVHLDNCNNGPITVDIIAHSGPGQLLGNLLGGLSHLLDSHASLVALTNKLDRIAHEILHLL
jgi:hypothetical protein